MKIIYGKQLTNEEYAICQQIALECDILIDTARLLFCRGIDTVKKAKTFLSPSKKSFFDPFLLSGMRGAVDRIRLAKEKNQNVLVFGDYDADGICATATLYYCLRDFGVNALTLIPEREDGYGLNLDKIHELHVRKKIDLIITVDCGISDGKKIEELNGLGIDVVVTDHHEPPRDLPNCIAINPKLDNQEYPFNGLCGAGVAYKLGRALIGEDADKYLDFVALATVADSMDLVGENRDIVVEGLKLYNSKDIREQFKSVLADNAGRTVTAQTLAYSVAPKINAGGRMGNANLALNLFLTQAPNEIFDYTVKLNEYNIARQAECEKIYKQAKAIISDSGLENDQIILVKNSGWQAGFIGIVAAKLVEDYSRPVIVFAEQDGFFKGSARSVEQINIYDAISSVSELLLTYGGHSQAAGVSVSQENFDLLRKGLNDYVKNTCAHLELEKKVYAEWHIEGEISLRFAKEIEMLEPFGVGNKRPLFTTTVGEIVSRPLKAGSPHYTYKCRALEMLDFNGGGNVTALSLPIDKKVLFELNLSTYKNKVSLKGYSRQVIVDYGDFSEIKHCIFAKQLENISQDEQEYTVIDKSQVVNYKKIGTAFAVSDVETLKKFSELAGLNVSLFSLDGTNSACQIVVAPHFIPDNFKRIVYLDTPINLAKGDGKKYLVQENIGYKFLDKISTDRSVFAQYFIKLKNLVGKDFASISSFCARFYGEDDLYQFIFCTTVFLELNIFSVDGGKLVYNSNFKNPLTNSTVYSKINLIKG